MKDFPGRSWYVVGVIFVTMFEMRDSTKLAFYILASRKNPPLLTCKASAGEHTKITWPELFLLIFVFSMVAKLWEGVVRDLKSKQIT